MSRKTDSHPHFVNSDGSIFSTKAPHDGSISCTRTTPKNGTILYISVGTRPKSDAVATSNTASVVLPFPVHKQRARVTKVALQLTNVRTQRHAAYYRMQVSKAIDGQLSRKGIQESKRQNELMKFWQAVMFEVERQCRKGGAA